MCKFDYSYNKSHKKLFEIVYGELYIDTLKKFLNSCIYSSIVEAIGSCQEMNKHWKAIVLKRVFQYMLCHSVETSIIFFHSNMWNFMHEKVFLRGALPHNFNMKRTAAEVRF